MKGNQQVIDKLNELLREELSAINQYMVHSEMCQNWHYARLEERVEKRAITEMKHAEKLIERILFLEGFPQVGQLGKIMIGKDVASQLKYDVEIEYEAVAMYNDAIRLARDVGDNTTREILEEILHVEEDHIDWLEAQLSEVQQMGIQNYLGQQVKKD